MAPKAVAHQVEVRPRHALFPPQRPQAARQVLPHVYRITGGQVVHVIVPVVNLRQTRNGEMKVTAGLTLDQWARSDQSTRMTAWLRSRLSIQAAARKSHCIAGLLPLTIYKQRLLIPLGPGGEPMREYLGADKHQL